VSLALLSLTWQTTAFVPLKGERATRTLPVGIAPHLPIVDGTFLPTTTSTTTALYAAAKKKGAKKATVETVNKAHIIAEMAERSGLTKGESESALQAFLEVIQENVAEGKKVSLVGFGAFTLKERAARKGRNPQTGEELDIAASKSPGFTAGKAWKDRVNGR
jgi:DNA-binding protein HU-beta